MNINTKKGFTLIELLIVIGILAVLATVTVLVLNPAQLFAQARDSQRVQDLKTVSSAINLFLTTVSSPDMDGSGGDFSCASSFGASAASASTSMSGGSISQAGVYSISGTGWVPVDFTSMSAIGGSPISTLPRDPSNTSYAATPSNLNYQYKCDNTNKWYELNANMESSRYAATGADDRESTDGGNNPTYYEIGNDPSLDL